MPIMEVHDLGCVTHDSRVGPSEACATQPTHPIHLVACTNLTDGQNQLLNPFTHVQAG